ncbi:sushi domain-containing protein 2-like isoform X2 [Apostichopus japonicus]
MRKEDDSFVEVPLDFEFPFFDRNHRTLFLNTNGVLSFLSEVTQFTPDPFPLSDDRRLIAPFWADVDNTVAGEIYFREDRSPEIIQLVNQNIQRAFSVDFGRFVSSWVFIATWDMVAFYNNRQKQLKPINNTFQAVLASDGLHSFALFNYEKIEWTTGTASYGDKQTGSANTPNSVAAQVGFNAGDGINFFAVEGSRTQRVVNVTRLSNVGIPGRWMFRIDNADIESAGCEEIFALAELKISPSEVGMLGGEILAISGPCFDRTHDIYCRIDGMVSQASYNLAVDPFVVQCPTPAFMRLGRVLVELSFDGGESFKNNVTVTIVPLDNQADLVVITGENESSKRLSWEDGTSPFDLALEEVTNVDILLYSYVEDVVRGVVELRPVKALKTNIRFSNRNEVVDSSQLLERGMDVGIIRITETGAVDLKEDTYSWPAQSKSKTSVGQSEQPDPVPAMWSLPFNANPEQTVNANYWCRNWAKVAERVTILPEDSVLDCPCTVGQALGDNGHFEILPTCSGEGDIVDDCKYRQDARVCVRAKFGSNLLGRGQLCCYGNHSQLLNLNDNIAGGSIQSRHHLGFQPNYEVRNIPYFSNFLHDTIPWEECCGKTGKLSSCKLYSDLRPTSDCVGYSSPGIAAIFGEPHLTTWDNRSISFHGCGEYQLTAPRRSSNGLSIQGRLEEIFLGSGATGVTAVVAELDTSDRVQVEVNQRRDLEVWIFQKDDDRWHSPDFTLGNFYFANGVFVEVYRATSKDQTRTGALVTFRDDSSLEMKLPESGQSLNVLVKLSPSVKGDVWGLLGTWDDDSSNEFTLRDGSFVDHSDSAPLYNLLLDWRISEVDTLFRYANGKSASTYLAASELFIPRYKVATSGVIPEDNVTSICGESELCRFEYLKTGSAQQGRNTKLFQEEEGLAREGLRRAVSCGYLSPPENGYKEGDIYLLGYSVTFSCQSEFILRGSKMRSCDDTGSWSGNVTSCNAKEELDAEMDLLLWVMIGLAVALIMMLMLFCLLLMCCVCSRRKKIRENEKVMSSAHKLESSVIANNNATIIDESHSYNNTTLVRNGNMRHGNGHLTREDGRHVRRENGHVRREDGHVTHVNGYVNHDDGRMSNILLENDHMANHNIETPESIYYANPMSLGERHADGVSHAHLRNQDLPSGSRGTVRRTMSLAERHMDGVSHAYVRNQDLPTGSRGAIRRTPSLNQSGPSQGRPSLDQSGPSRGRPSYSKDGGPDLSCRPKTRARDNYYGDLPLKNINDNSLARKDKFSRNQNLEESDEDEVTRIKRILKEEAARNNYQ